jgi:hypothetical protein
MRNISREFTVAGCASVEGFFNTEFSEVAEKS